MIVLWAFGLLNEILGFWAFKLNHSKLGLLNEIILGYDL